MKPYFTKRCIAYLIDILLVVTISVVMTGFVPISEKAKTISENIVYLTNGVTEEKITKEEYVQEIQDLNYELTEETVIFSLINISVYLLYFVVYPVYNNGQTIGKKTQNLKIVNKNNQEANMDNLLIRTLILYGVAINIVNLILLVIISKNKFILVNNILNYFYYLILIIILFMVIFSETGRGLHDILSNTKVIIKEEK